MTTVILKYKMYKNDQGNSITLCFTSKTEASEYLKKFLSEPIYALSWSKNPLYGHGEIPYSATLTY